MTNPDRTTRRHLRPLLLWGMLICSLGAGPDSSCNLTAGPNGLCANIRLEPDNAVLNVGQSLVIRINAGSCSSAGPCPCAQSALVNARWKSDAPAIAPVDSAGVVAGMKPGTAVIVFTPAAGTGIDPQTLHVTVVK